MRDVFNIVFIENATSNVSLLSMLHLTSTKIFYRDLLMFVERPSKSIQAYFHLDLI